MKYRVIDNFLDEEYFDSLVSLFMGERFHWFFLTDVAYPKNHKRKNTVEEDNKSFYMMHTVYDQNQPCSNTYDNLIPLLEKLGVWSLVRAKLNLYPNTHKLHEHQLHVDYDFSHFGAILSLNTCDGGTKLKDGTKIDSVANRILLFDPSEEHCSTTTTNVPARFNININYIQTPNWKI